MNDSQSKIKTREGSGYLKQLYSTARTTAGTTHSNLKNNTTFLVNFIPLDRVDASELQVRAHFDESELLALSESIKQHGVLQPILVVQDGDRYQVIAGERRLRAARLAQQDRIPARVLSTSSKATHEISLRENLDRVDLHPIEEGEGYASLLEAGIHPSHDAIAKAFGKPKSRITECIGFTKLPELTRQELLLRGLKGRALLRTLLTAPLADHMRLIEKAAQLESGTPPKAAGPGGKPQATEVAPLQYTATAEAVRVPAFSWKQGQGTEKLHAYVRSLRELLSELERLG